MIFVDVCVLLLLFWFLLWEVVWKCGSLVVLCGLVCGWSCVWFGYCGWVSVGCRLCVSIWIC